MGASGPSEPRAAQRSARRRIAELEEGQGWAHHVADLDAGTVASAALDRPPAPLSRAERLARVGFPLDWGVLDGPAQRLTPRSPYVASPEAFLIAERVSLSAFDDRITWQLPESPGPAERGVLRAHFATSPTGRSLLTISLAGLAWSGAAGEVSVSIANNDALVRVPVDAEFRSHTIDVGFTPLVPETDVLMVLTAIRTIDLRAIALRAAPPVFHQGPP